MSKFYDLYRMVSFSNISGEEFEKELVEAISERYPKLAGERAKLIVRFAFEDVGDDPGEVMYLADKYAHRMEQVINIPV